MFQDLMAFLEELMAKIKSILELFTSFFSKTPDEDVTPDDASH